MKYLARYLTLLLSLTLAFNASAENSTRTGGYMGTPVHAQVRVAAKTLFGQIRPIELREIVEDQAIYYIADFPVAHREVLLFEFEVLPDGGRYPLQASMRQEFWTN